MDLELAKALFILFISFLLLYGAKRTGKGKSKKHSKEQLQKEANEMKEYYETDKEALEI